MAVKGPTAKRESADFPTNLRECTTLIVLLHSHCSTERSEPAARMPFPALHRDGYCASPAGSLEEAGPPAPHPLRFPFPGQSLLFSSSRGCVKACGYRTLAVYRKFYQSATDLSSANYCVKYFIKHFLK